MARLDINWKQIGGEGLGSNPLLPLYEAELGRDKHGRTWLCRVRYRYTVNLFQVYFDTDEVTDEDGPFLRNKVVDAEEYHKAFKREYYARMCRYEAIQDAIWEFIVKHEVDAKDVTGKQVVD